MQPPINFVFANNGVAKREWLQEYFIPEEHLTKFIPFLSEVLNRNNVALLNASVRFVKKDERSVLGYATRGDCFAVVLFFTQALKPEEREATKRWVREVIDFLKTHDGTFYLPYVHMATREQFQECYPQHKAVLEAKNKYDPDCLFDNVKPENPN